VESERGAQGSQLPPYRTVRALVAADLETRGTGLVTVVFPPDQLSEALREHFAETAPSPRASTKAWTVLSGVSVVCVIIAAMPVVASWSVWHHHHPAATHPPTAARSTTARTPAASPSRP